MNAKNKICLLILMVCIFVMGSFSFAQTIEVGIYQNPPLVGLDEQGKASGFFVDLMNAVAKEEGLDLHYTFDNLDNGFKNLESGTIDLLLAIAYTDERSEKYLYSKETVYTNWGQIYSKKGLEIDSFLELEGKVIGVELADVHYVGEHGIKNLLEGFNVSVTYKEYATRITMLEDLENGIIDAAVVSRLFGEYYESNYSIHLTPIQFNPIKIKVITANQDYQGILDIFDKAMVRYKSDEQSIYYKGLNSMLSFDSKMPIPDYVKTLMVVLITSLVVSGITLIISRRKLYKQSQSIFKQNKQLKKLIEQIASLSAYTKMELLFEELVRQVRGILVSDQVQIVSIIHLEEGYCLDEADYVTERYKSYAGENVENVPLQYLKVEDLDAFDQSSNSIAFFENKAIVRYHSSYHKTGFLYIETHKEIIEKEFFSIYMINILSNLQTIISNLNRLQEKTKLFISLGELIEKRDKTVANHVKRVSEATKLLAAKCGFKGEKLNNIVIASSIHDIGKIYVPDQILNKPGKLTDEEFELIKAHATDDFKIIDDVNETLSKTVHDVVRYHHENWDGTGYPEGLSNEQIPIEARIVSVIDVFEALTHNRPYKKAWTFEEGIAFIDQNRGIKFDPVLVELFLEVSDKIYNIFMSYPDEQE